MTSTPRSFEAQEEDVLSWLLERPEVSDAVDLALGGKDAEAGPLLVRAIRGILGKAEKDSGRNGPSEARSSRARRKRSASKPPPMEVDHVEGEENPAVASATPSKRRKPEAVLNPARCVCIVVSGLPGSGKTTVCRMLREALGGAWLDHDDFAAKHAGKDLRQVEAITFRAMLSKSLGRSAHDQNGRFLFVDKGSILRKDRGEIMQELQRAQWQGRGGKILFVELGHSADTYSHGDDGQIAKRFSAECISLCTARVEARGAAHHKLRPSPKLRSIIKSMAKAAEPLHADELAEFDGRVMVDATKSPVEVALSLLEELQNMRWLDGLKESEELRAKLETAWQACQRSEQQWRTSVAAAADTVVDLEQPQDEWLSQCQQALEADQKREQERANAKARAEGKAIDGMDDEDTVQVSEAPVPIYWKIDLPEVSKVLQKRKILPASMKAVEKPHTTLLYLGGADGDVAKMARQSNISEEQFLGMRQVLEDLDGEEFEVKMLEIIEEENVVCAVVSLPPIVPCMNKVPHVTLGTKPGVPARYSNEVLEEVKGPTGRKEGITSIKLDTPRPLKGRLMLHYSH